MAFELPQLPYSHDSLSDFGMSKETLEYHHDLHHKAYVDNGNKLLVGSEHENKNLEDIIRDTYEPQALVQSGLFNNASQHWNHIQFWEMMGPKRTSMPTDLENKIVNDFGSVQEFKDKFCAFGAGQFGSGWCWLVQDSSGVLSVTKTENGVNPICYNQTALLGCDVWEHSYYLDYKNKRPIYLENFFDKLINWEFVESNL